MDKYEVSLELDKLLDILKDYASSVVAQNKIVSDDLCIFSPREDYAYIKEAYDFLYNQSLSYNLNFDDIIPALNNARKNIILSGREILDIATFLRLSNLFNLEVKKTVDLSLIKSLSKNIYINNDFVELCDRTFLSENELLDSASVNLKMIRDGIREYRQKISSRLNEYLTSSQFRHCLQNNQLVEREGRFVIALKSDFRSKIKGIVHSLSQSGQTVFVEPYDLVEMNNILKEIYQEEKREIERILKHISEAIKREADNIENSFNLIVDIDILFAKAKFKYKYLCVEPIIVKDKNIKIIEGRHPLIDKNKVVPINVSASNNESVIVISGSNTGGKTVSLKLIGLFALMIKRGIPICAKECTMAIYDNVFCDIGDEQSIEMSLSTFSSHMLNIKNIIDKMTSKSLILLDELAMGTDPKEGEALAIAIIDKLYKNSARCIVTTHYSKLKMYALDKEYIKLFAVDFNPLTFEPTYRLLEGVAGSSNAINIASNLGIDGDIISDAKSRLSDDDINIVRIIKTLEERERLLKIKEEELNNEYKNFKENKKFLEKKLKDIEQREKHIKDLAKDKANLLINSYIDEANDIILKLREIEKQYSPSDKYRVYDLKSKLSNKLDNSSSNNLRYFEYDSSKITQGDYVVYKDMSQAAKVLSLNEKKGKMKILLGQIEMDVKISDVKKIKSEDIKDDVNIETSHHIIDSKKEVKASLDLRGLNSDEALDRLDEYLDLILHKGLISVTIIHGKGNGILRRVVWDRLKNDKNIKSYRMGNSGEGDSGVCIVYLND